MFFNKNFILASKSKSRIFILKKNKLNFKCISPTCDENIIIKQKIKKKVLPQTISLCLAKKKAISVCKNNKNSLVVACDTIIELN